MHLVLVLLPLLLHLSIFLCDAIKYAACGRVTYVAWLQVWGTNIVVSTSSLLIKLPAFFTNCL